MAHCRRTGFRVIALMACGLWPASLSAQVPSYQPPGQLTVVNANVTAVTGVHVRDLENGASSLDAALKDDDTALPRAATVSVLGLVKNPGVYSLRRTAPTTVLGGARARRRRHQSRVEVADRDRAAYQRRTEEREGHPGRRAAARRHGPGHRTVLLNPLRSDVRGLRGLSQPAPAEGFRTCDRMPWSCRSPSVSAAGPGCRM